METSTVRWDELPCERSHESMLIARYQNMYLNTGLQHGKGCAWRIPACLSRKQTMEEVSESPQSDVPPPRPPPGHSVSLPSEPEQLAPASRIGIRRASGLGSDCIASGCVNRNVEVAVCTISGLEVCHTCSASTFPLKNRIVLSHAHVTEHDQVLSTGRCARRTDRVIFSPLVKPSCMHATSTDSSVRGEVFSQTLPQPPASKISRRPKAELPSSSARPCASLRSPLAA